jgi:integrase
MTEAREQFVKAAREGRALNKHGRRYKRKAIDLIEGRLKHDVEPRLGRRHIGDIRRGEVQAIVDDLTPVASGSSVRGVVNSLRALYTWAEDRDLVSHNPAARVKLPAMNATPIERVATPAEFARLLAALGRVDALAYGLAAYAMARAEQIRRARWQDVDLKVGAIELGVDPDARKSDAAHRVIPAVPPLLVLLKRAYLEAGRPDGGELLCPPRYRARKSGLLSTNGLAKRAHTQWGATKLEPITLQECRHTAATWLDAAQRVAENRVVSDGAHHPEQAGGGGDDHAGAVHARPPRRRRPGARATRRTPGAGAERGHRLTGPFPTTFP